ncbi:hypothetical protein [Robertmurraya sp. DFI.2.37]|nr:hypothetical protein [Robertmurraya sp. DFI.2.37]
MTQKVLTDQLKPLEKNCLVKRVIFNKTS